jgi:beta-glucosidase
MSEADIAEVVTRAIQSATLSEKIGMMSGRGFFEQYRQSGKRWGAHPYQAGGGCERLGLPALFFTDGPRGVCRGESTCFPCTMGRGATFDSDLERRVGEAMGIEARAQGCNLSGAVCVNVLRHPAWGRAQETYGEDPFHLGEMGAALAEGIQTHNVIATVKHFALNSIENSRFRVDVTADARALHEVYLPHFKRILDAGCASVMSAYNKVNGEYCGQNRVLLTDILRGLWQFDGFVHSDWVKGVYQTYGAAAGLDIENPEPLVWGDKLRAAVEDGSIEPHVIDTACRRILTTLYRFASAEDPLPNYGAELVASDAHVRLAREAALKSAVLLKNDGVLPFDRSKTRRLAVLGRLAAIENLGDFGSSRVHPPYAITPRDGLRRFLGDEVEILSGDESGLEEAGAAAARADAVVVVVGYTAKEEGEFIPEDIALGADKPQKKAAVASTGGDRTSLGLSADQVALIRAAVAANARTVVVIVAGSAVMVTDWIDEAPALLQTFYSGMEGGAALASLLFGENAPSGKMPFTVPKDERDLPFFDKDASAITYDLWHGYTKLEREERKPQFPFGFGLSYARFEYRALRARRMGDAIHAQVSVVNCGDVAADEVVQLYVGFPGRDVERPRKLLRGFKRVTLRPQETQTVRFEVPVSGLGWWNELASSWVLEHGVHTVHAGGSSRDEDLLVTQLGL